MRWDANTEHEGVLEIRVGRCKLFLLADVCMATMRTIRVCSLDEEEADEEEQEQEEK